MACRFLAPQTWSVQGYGRRAFEHCVAIAVWESARPGVRRVEAGKDVDHNDRPMHPSQVAAMPTSTSHMEGKRASLGGASLRRKSPVLFRTKYLPRKAEPTGRNCQAMRSLILLDRLRHHDLGVPGSMQFLVGQRRRLSIGGGGLFLFHRKEGLVGFA